MMNDEIRDDPEQYFAFLTSSYLDDPTPEKAQRLWRAAFGLKAWYLLLTETPRGFLPYIGTHEGRTYVAVWTDMGTLSTYTESPTVAAAGRELRYMMIPLPQAVEHLLGYEEQGIDGVRFNPPLGWSVPFATLRAVAEHLMPR